MWFKVSEDEIRAHEAESDFIHAAGRMIAERLGGRLEKSFVSESNYIYVSVGDKRLKIRVSGHSNGWADLNIQTNYLDGSGPKLARDFGAMFFQPCWDGVEDLIRFANRYLFE